MAPRLRVLEGGAVLAGPVTRDPWEFQALCVDALVASWRARGFSPVTIGNDSALLERALKALVHRRRARQVPRFCGAVR